MTNDTLIMTFILIFFVVLGTICFLNNQAIGIDGPDSDVERTINPNTVNQTGYSVFSLNKTGIWGYLWTIIRMLTWYGGFGGLLGDILEFVIFLPMRAALAYIIIRLIRGTG